MQFSLLHNNIIILGLSRGYEPGLRELLVKGGFSTITDFCLQFGIRKVTIKALFMISSFYTSETDLELQGIYHIILLFKIILLYMKLKYLQSRLLL